MWKLDVCVLANFENHEQTHHLVMDKQRPVSQSGDCNKGEEQELNVPVTIVYLGCDFLLEFSQFIFGEGA